MANSVRVASTEEIAPGQRKAVEVDDVPALLLRVGDEFYCIEDVCTHDGQPLTNGPLEGCAIICPRHGAKFDLRSGKALCMPATEAVRTFPVEVRGTDIHVMV